MQESAPLSHIDFPVLVDGCRLDYDDNTRMLRITSPAIYREFHVRDNVLYSGAFDVDPAEDTYVPPALIETFRFAFLDGHPRQEFTMSVRSSGESGPYAGGLEPRAETTFTLEQAIGPYGVRFVLALVPGLPFVRSMLSIQGPPWSPDSPSTETDKNLAFTSMENDPVRAARYLVPPQETVDAVPHSIIHGTLEKSLFFDDTDRHDFLVERTACDLYGNDHPHAGNLFVVRDRSTGNAFLMLKDGPTLHSSLQRNCDEFFWRDGAACGIRGSGIDPAELFPTAFAQSYGAILGVGEQAQELLRTYLAVTGPRIGRTPFMLSNTWGDRNRDAALNEQFARGEIDAAAELGIDYVQLDDGWQRGITKNSRLAKGGVWEGYYATDEHFWAVNEQKFPNGLEPIVRYASEHNVKLGLWFSPDSWGSFRNWRHDADTLLEFYHSLGIDQFKLDGIKIRDKQGERNLLRLLEALEEESDGGIDYCMDVTAEIRLGYIYGRRHGKIFLENRYTDWGNYYPYRTLRNLWMLARHLPARRFQIEVLNNRRNEAVYGTDPLAPARYRMDYLFAIAMTATPLLFMELTNLDSDARAELAPILAVYREIRDDLSSCDVIPIGTRPDGRSYSGFQCVRPGGGGFLVLFRDLASERESGFELAEAIAPRTEPRELYSSASWEIDVSAGHRVTVTSEEPRSFVVLRY
ncbi:MAG: glycoside hydrolase family 97 catalytic domain-containing protein [Spirochaetales bacterium]